MTEKRTGLKFISDLPGKSPREVFVYRGIPIVVSPDCPPQSIQLIDGNERLVGIRLGPGPAGE